MEMLRWGNRLSERGERQRRERERETNTHRQSHREKGGRRE